MHSLYLSNSIQNSTYNSNMASSDIILNCKSTENKRQYINNYKNNELMHNNLPLKEEKMDSKDTPTHSERTKTLQTNIELDSNPLMYDTKHQWINFKCVDEEMHIKNKNNLHINEEGSTTTKTITTVATEGETNPKDIDFDDDTFYNQNDIISNISSNISNFLNTEHSSYNTHLEDRRTDKIHSSIDYQHLTQRLNHLGDLFSLSTQDSRSSNYDLDILSNHQNNIHHGSITISPTKPLDLYNSQDNISNDVDITTHVNRTIKSDTPKLSCNSNDHTPPLQSKQIEPDFNWSTNPIYNILQHNPTIDTQPIDLFNLKFNTSANHDILNQADVLKPPIINDLIDNKSYRTASVHPFNNTLLPNESLFRNPLNHTAEVPHKKLNNNEYLNQLNNLPAPRTKNTLNFIQRDDIQINPHIQNNDDYTQSTQDINSNLSLINEFSNIKPINNDHLHNHLNHDSIIDPPINNDTSWIFKHSDYPQISTCEDHKNSTNLYDYKNKNVLFNTENHTDTTSYSNRPNNYPIDTTSFLLTQGHLNLMNNLGMGFKRWQNLNIVLPIYICHGKIAVLQSTGENTYVFPNMYSDAQLIFSNVERICDIWATNLRLRIAVVHKCPQFLVPHVAQIFNKALSTLPEFSEPISISACGLVKHTIRLRSSGNVTYRYDTIGNLLNNEDKDKMQNIFTVLQRMMIDVNDHLSVEIDKLFYKYQNKMTTHQEPTLSNMRDISYQESQSTFGLKFRFSPCKEFKIAVREGTSSDFTEIDTWLTSANGISSTVPHWTQKFKVQPLILGELRLERDKCLETQIDPFFLPNYQIKTRSIIQTTLGKPARKVFVNHNIYPSQFMPPVHILRNTTPDNASQILCGTQRIFHTILPRLLRSDHFITNQNSSNNHISSNYPNNTPNSSYWLNNPNLYNKKLITNSESFGINSISEQDLFAPRNKNLLFSNNNYDMNTKWMNYKNNGKCNVHLNSMKDISTDCNSLYSSPINPLSYDALLCNNKLSKFNEDSKYNNLLQDSNKNLNEKNMSNLDYIKPYLNDIQQLAGSLNHKDLNSNINKTSNSMQSIDEGEDPYQLKQDLLTSQLVNTLKTVLKHIENKSESVDTNHLLTELKYLSATQQNTLLQ